MPYDYQIATGRDQELGTAFITSVIAGVAVSAATLTVVLVMLVRRDDE